MSRSSYTSPLATDFANLLEHSEPLWRELQGARVLLTGGTGFVGCWLLEALLAAHARFDIDVRIDVLARRPERLAQIASHLATSPIVNVVHADIRSDTLASDCAVGLDGTDPSRRPHGRYTHVVHAATETNVALDNPAPLAAFDASVAGTRNVLDLCRRHEVRRFLLISSGAVYGRSHALDRPLAESGPLAGVRGDLTGAYALGKAAAEFLAIASGTQHAMTSVAARCFSFIGPYQPLNSGFAAGNFLRDALEGKPISIKGDGTPRRSYLYGADMALWLWTMLLRGSHGEIFNVGSDNPVSIADLARTIAREVSASAGAPMPEVDIARSPAGGTPELFVPDVGLARARFGLVVTTPLEIAIRRTAHWARTAGAVNPAALRISPPPARLTPEKSS